MSKIRSIALAALIIAVGSNSLLNAQSLKSTIYHQEGWDNCGAKKCVTEAPGGTSTSIEGTFFRPVTSSDHDSRARAEIAFRPTEEFNFVHPRTRLSVENRGGTGGSDRMYAHNKATGFFQVTPKLTGTLSAPLDVNIKTFDVHLYDKGMLYSPKLRRFFHSRQKVIYRRSFKVNAVRDRADGPKLKTNYDRDESEGAPSIKRSVRGYASGPRQLLLSEPSKFNFDVVTAYPFDEPEDDALIVEYTYTNSLEIDNPATFRLDSSTTAFGDFYNTSGISGLALFDENGQDVTRFFEITNSAGTLLFGVPEPSSLLLSLTAFACAFLRRYR